MKTPRFSIRLEGESLTFSASHFITFRADEKGGGALPIVETPHRHDFRVRAEIGGPLGTDSLLIDFQAARDALLEILTDCRNKTILAAGQAGVETRIEGNEIEVVFDARDSDPGRRRPERLVLRREETLILPSTNASAEAAALFLAQRFFSALEKRGLLTAGADRYSLTLSLEEEPGMIAEVTLE